MRLIDGRQAKAARAILGMTVREMAEAAGVDRNTVMRVEHMKGIRVSRYDGGGHGVRCISAAIGKRGIILDVQDGQPVIRFATTAPPPKYRKKGQPAA